MIQEAYCSFEVARLLEEKGFNMVGTLEKECMVRDKGKVATELFIRINDVKHEMAKVVSESERIMRRADIDNFGPLSKYIRPYLAY